MEYSLSITSIVETGRDGQDQRSPITIVMAETDLGQHSEAGVPDVFFGKLVDVSVEKILYLKFAPGVSVMFRGWGYKFEELEQNGAFKLVIGF